MKLNVQFSFNRFPLKTMHRAVNFAFQQGLDDLENQLFPRQDSR